MGRLSLPLIGTVFLTASAVGAGFILQPEQAPPLPQHAPTRQPAQAGGFVYPAQPCPWNNARLFWWCIQQPDTVPPAAVGLLHDGSGAIVYLIDADKFFPAVGANVYGANQLQQAIDDCWTGVVKVQFCHK